MHEADQPRDRGPADRLHHRRAGDAAGALALFLRATRRTPAFARSHPRRAGRNEGVVRRAVALAAEVPEEVEAEAPTLSRAAREVGVSPNHLNRLLRQQTGLTFRQLLIQRRIELAKTLLRYRRRALHGGGHGVWLRRQQTTSPASSAARWG
jgi:AraC-like DNA-binding protein